MSDDTTTQQPLVMGKIGSAYGLKGWVKIHSFTAPSANLFEYRPWWIKQKGQWRTIELLKSKPHGDTHVAHFEGFNDRDEARSLTGASIGITRDQLPEPEEDEYYWHDLIGAKVKNTEGTLLGTLSEFFDATANDVMHVVGKQEYLIPWVLDHFVQKVDLDSGEIIVDWQEEQTCK